MNLNDPDNYQWEYANKHASTKSSIHFAYFKKFKLDQKLEHLFTNVTIEPTCFGNCHRWYMLGHSFSSDEGTHSEWWRLGDKSVKSSPGIVDWSFFSFDGNKCEILHEAGHEQKQSIFGQYFSRTHPFASAERQQSGSRHVKANSCNWLSVVCKVHQKSGE